MISFSLYNDGIDQIDDRTNRVLVSEESSVAEFVELSDSNSVMSANVGAWGGPPNSKW